MPQGRSRALFRTAAPLAAIALIGLLALGTRSSDRPAPTTTTTTEPEVALRRTDVLSIAPTTTTTTTEPGVALRRTDVLSMAPATAAPLRLSGPADVFVAPAAQGTGDGRTAANAAGIERLNEFLRVLEPGSVIELLADKGAYDLSQPITLNAGGAEDAPITIRGPVEGSSAELRGNRAYPYDPGGETGRALFRLVEGADHLIFANLHCTRAGNGCFHVAGPITDLTITATTADNVRRFFENQAGTGQTDATIVGLEISHVKISGFSKGAIRLAHDTHDGRITDVVGDSGQQDGDNFAVGVHLLDTVHDVVIERVTMDNARDTLHEYWNGDGFAAERGVSNLQFIGTSASGNTDAGYDLKASNVRMVDVAAHDNKRNYRLWGQEVILENCRGTDPHRRGGTGTQAQVQIGENALVELVDCTFTDQDTATIVFDVDGQAQLIVRSGRVDRSSGGQLSSVDPAASIDLLGITERTR